MGASVSISVSRLVDAVTRILQGAGVAHEDALTVALALVAADQEDIASHGVMLVPLYVERLLAGSVVARAKPAIVADGDTVIVLDAQHGLGQVSSTFAVELAASRARRYGMASVAVRNGFHFGTGGRWAGVLAQHGLVGIAMSNTRPLMPAPGGAQAVVGNNPLAIGLPSEEGVPLVLDMAMSASAMGKIRLARAQGASIPPGWATDAHGAPTTDPAAAIEGMLLPAAGPKGFGLAVMIDLLCGGLAHGGVGDAVKPLYGNAALPYGCSHFFLAIDVNRFLPLEQFRATVSARSSHIRASRRAPGVEQLHMPGDIAAHQSQRHRNFVTLPSALLGQLDESARAVGIPLPSLTESTGASSR
ncbi:Ldh family oxidoreductase [Pendulispora rubella]|uniref:Ldh family oxidoreductase n=1 Tax=Pendulispora rubella TaxID=2741070 RepID=A0ABZ2KW59_9BACT